MAQGSGVMIDFVFLFEFGLAAMVYVLSGRDDDYACRFGSYQDSDCVTSSLFFFFVFVCVGTVMLIATAALLSH
jgi:hypothetical protein